MVYEFEGKTEKEAIDKAVAELNLSVDKFDVEILEVQKGGLFKKGMVKIRVHVDMPSGLDENPAPIAENAGDNAREHAHPHQIVTSDIIEKVQAFLAEIIERMGYVAEIHLLKHEADELTFKISGPDSPHIIGKKGKTLDALQLFANIYLVKLNYGDVRAVVDCENYRRHKEETIIRMAYKVADRVAMTKRSVLLEPMNPYERRLVHTTLSNISSIETKSEGDGLYKQVRVLYKK